MRDSNLIERECQDLLRRMLAALPDGGEFSRLCAAVSDWDALFHIAGEQGVPGVLLHALDEHGVDLGIEFNRKRALQYFVLAARSEPLAASLGDAMKVLARGGVPAIALKGILLLERCYPAGLVRPTSDVDILVARDRLDEAVAALVAGGFVYPDEEANRSARRHHHHVTLTQPGASHTLELHFDAWSGPGARIPAEGLLDRAKPYHSRLGFDAFVLSPEDELLYLTVHAVMHFRVSLRWVYDLKVLLQKNPGLDWNLTATRARAYGVFRAFSFGARQLAELLAVAVPLDKLAPPGRITTRLIEALRGAAIRAEYRGPVKAFAFWGFSILIADHRVTAARAALGGFLRVLRRRLTSILSP